MRKWVRETDSLFLHHVGVCFGVERFADPVTDNRALPRTPGQAIHTWTHAEETDRLYTQQTAERETGRWTEQTHNTDFRDISQFCHLTTIIDELF